MQAIRDLIATRQITNLITNHTTRTSCCARRAWRRSASRSTSRCTATLGRRIADTNGYANIPSFQLYDTTGSTEDWSYWTAGGLGFTFEIGDEEFHPEFSDAVVGEYLGRAPAAGAGKGGNREAYYRMLEATVDAANHSVIRGEAPKGATLTIAKAFETETSPVLQPAADGSLQPTAPIRFPERLESSMVTGGDGAFSWAVNPSTRPYVAGRYGREPLGPVPPGAPLVNPAGVPAENQEGNILDGAYEEATFTVPAPPEGDAGQVFVDVGWTNPATDWDVYVYDETGAQIASAATGGTNSERATMLLPEPGTYTVRFVNYDQVDGAPVDDWTGSVSFAAPTPAVPGTTEAWTLTCTRPDGAADDARSRSRSRAARPPTWARPARRPRADADLHSGGSARGLAGVAQLVEQLSCKQQVVGSNPISGSRKRASWHAHGRAASGARARPAALRRAPASPPPREGRTASRRPCSPSAAGAGPPAGCRSCGPW